jgi:hypothetical protein
MDQDGLEVAAAMVVQWGQAGSCTVLSAPRADAECRYLSLYAGRWRWLAV